MNRKPILWATTAAVVITTAMSLWTAPRMPAQVPLHWNVKGIPDRFGSPLEALLVGPLVSLGIGLLLWALPLIEPRREHLAQSARAYNAVGVVLAGFFVVLHGGTLASGLDQPVPIERLVPAACGLIFVVLGNYLGKTRSNWFFGIRLPWTMQSERSWAKTHRLGGRLFAGLGAAIVLIALLAPPAVTFAVLMGGLALILVVCAAYSYREWRLDPARQP